MKKDRRKINNAMSRRAAARRVQEKVEEHDEKVVVFIWGCRILGWSLRRIAAALDASIAPPGQRAGYKAGKWTAAAVQRICRRYEIRTDRAPYPPASLLRYIRAGVTVSRQIGGPRPVHVNARRLRTRPLPRRLQARQGLQVPVFARSGEFPRIGEKKKRLEALCWPVRPA